MVAWYCDTAATVTVASSATLNIKATCLDTNQVDLCFNDNVIKALKTKRKIHLSDNSKIVATTDSTWTALAKKLYDLVKPNTPGAPDTAALLKALTPDATEKCTSVLYEEKDDKKIVDMLVTSRIIDEWYKGKKNFVFTPDNLYGPPIIAAAAPPKPAVTSVEVDKSNIFSAMIWSENTFTIFMPKGKFVVGWFCTGSANALGAPNTAGAANANFKTQVKKECFLDGYDKCYSKE